jgi:carboxymethylenebutenolidase
MAIEKDITVALPDGETDAVLLHPAGSGPWPGILYLTDIGGIRPAQRQGAQRLADLGYVILLPNVFYRVAKPPVMDMAALRSNHALFMQRIKELTHPLTPAAQERDAQGYVDFITSLASVKKGKLGVVGFCFSGALAMRVAAVAPHQVVACASFHGGGLFTDTPDSPHLLLPRIQARLLFGHAENDRSMPAEAISSFEAALKSWGGRYESETYLGAQHGWTTLDNPIYHPTQAARAFEKLTALFQDQLNAS